MSQPFSEEDLIASAMEALKVRGDARAIPVLVAGKGRLSQWNSDGGIDEWRFFIALPANLMGTFSSTIEDNPFLCNTDSF
jgi:hypothetical protein